jgi:hypothetical protein
MGHVAFVGGDLDLFEQAHRKAQRNRHRARLKIAEACAFRAAPSEIDGRILPLPIGALLGFRRERRVRLARSS